MSFGSNGVDQVRSLRKISSELRAKRPNETVRNALIHYFWVLSSGWGAFVAKISDTTLFSELVR
jgi:hypothetical protein